ncbi:MAG: hypothetical protein A3C56_12565 [Ignavibacteria bacterium RIFCSPHIGHO2_02_FULL_56_12]|nr:MAG: hypothetical protein A3C56_12565 [Ignavibacteria bacterium RIFCSPHIGHO2_02_FULL_56_12]
MQYASDLTRIGSTAMIKRIILIIGSLAAMTVVATGQEAETLFAGEVVHGGFGGPVLKASTVNGSPALFVGGRGGWIINHSFILGGGGYGLVANVDARVPSVYGDRRLAFGYGGVEMEYVHDWDRLIHVSVMLLIGGGGVGYQASVDDPRGSNYDHPMDEVFVLEPAVEAHLNVTEFFRLSAGVAYRYVNGVTTPTTSNASLSGGSAVMTFRFGEF